MSHEVEQMMYRGAVPWHGLGVPVKEAPTAEEAIKLAGLDWKVKLHPLYLEQEGKKQNADTRIPHRAVTRESDGQIYAVVGPDYTPVQNTEAFAFFNDFIEAGECTFETAGSLKMGRRIWVLAKLNRAPIEVVKNDVVEKFLMLSNGHDGSMAVRVGYTPIRVVCANTLALSHQRGKHSSNRLIRLSHTKNVHRNLDAVKEIVNAADAKFEATTEQYRALAKRGISQADIRDFVEQIFVPKHVTVERAVLRADKMTETITRLFETGRGNNMPGVAGTAWALYNAATEYLGYEHAKTQDNRLDNLWFGGGVKLNQHAFDVALKMAVK